MTSNLSEEAADSEEEWDILTPQSSKDCPIGYTDWNYRENDSPGEDTYCKKTGKKCLKHNCPRRL